MFAVLGILVLMTCAIVVGSLFAPPELVKSMIDGRIVSRGIVVFLIVPTVAILCVQERISGEGCGCLVVSNRRVHTWRDGDAMKARRSAYGDIAGGG